MSIIIEMRGRLEPIEVNMTMKEALIEFNVAAVKGNMFSVLTKPDGKDVGIYIPNMLTFEETDDDTYLA